MKHRIHLTKKERLGKKTMSWDDDQIKKTLNLEKNKKKKTKSFER